MTSPKPWQLVPPGRETGRTAKGRFDPRSRRTVTIWMLLAIGLIAVHLFYPAPREANQDLGVGFMVALGGGWNAVRTWRERRSDMPFAIAWVVIAVYGLLFVYVAISQPHRVIPWFLNPPVLMATSLLVVALGTHSSAPSVVELRRNSGEETPEVSNHEPEK